MSDPANDTPTTEPTTRRGRQAGGARPKPEKRQYAAKFSALQMRVETAAVLVRRVKEKLPADNPAADTLGTALELLTGEAE